jgi:hypothetical protein
MVVVIKPEGSRLGWSMYVVEFKPNSPISYNVVNVPHAKYCLRFGFEDVCYHVYVPGLALPVSITREHELVITPSSLFALGEEWVGDIRKLYMYIGGPFNVEIIVAHSHTAVFIETERTMPKPSLIHASILATPMGLII